MPKPFEDCDCEEDLKQYCTWGDLDNNVTGLCEGRWCERAYEKYVEESEEDDDA